MRISRLLIVCLSLCVCLAGSAHAITFEMADGTTMEGEIVQGRPESLQIRVAEGRYERIPWEKFSQKTLKQLIEDSRLKLETFIEPYIEISEDERVKKTEVTIKPPPRLERPVKSSLLGALFGSSVGLVMLLALYGANIYAGYEIAIIRAYPPAMVCGISAVAPVIGPVVFLFMPTRLESARAEEEHEEAVKAAPPPVNPLAPSAPSGSFVARSAPVVPGTHSSPTADQDHGSGGLHIAKSQSTSSATQGTELPKTEVFKRGQFTFNRRFIETKFSGFFGAIRRDANKDMVLKIKTVRGEYVAVRISRIAAADMHIESRKGEATQEIAIPFAEIQEIQYRHKDA